MSAELGSAPSSGVSRVRVTIGARSTPRGKSHSCERATISSSAPSAQAISVAAGSRLAMRTVSSSREGAAFWQVGRCVPRPRPGCSSRAQPPVEIQPLVIGTAGHIDHGKSTLVHALTGVDPDRLPEEKERGLTIDLGFAPLVLPSGRTVGMVDVPGHERFLKNMVAGATGIDFVLLVIAADDGVMPQTREHLQIMQLLGLERGLVALTKIDAVEPALVDLAELDVRELVAGTFLEHAPILRVSAHTGAGLDELRAALQALADAATPRSAEGVFRMSVQRVFSARGHGTVVTGIPVAGRVGIGAALEVLPGGAQGRVRSLQAYKQSVDTARAGHSTAINLSDVRVDEVRRGSVVAAPGYFRALAMLGVRLTALASLERPLENRTRIRFHTGTADPSGEIVLLDVERLEPGATCLAQVRLDEPVVCAPGDRFLLRLLSPERTLGGGVIVEESRWRLKRFKEFVIDELAHQEQSLGSPAQLLEAMLLRRGAVLSSAQDLSLDLKLPVADVAALLAKLGGKSARAIGKSGKWMHAQSLTRGLARVTSALEQYFAANPLRSAVETSVLRASTGYDEALFHALLEEAAARQQLVLEAGGKVRAAGRSLALDAKSRALFDALRERLAAARFQPPTQPELAAAFNVKEAEIKRMLTLLADEGHARHVGEGLYFATAALEEARAAIAANCEKHGHLEIPALRDALDTTRKWLIPLLEHFDAQGLTIRQGANRVLRKR
ncbi:MAG: selenocysteine-specific translation elongation factor [Planctomycetota bacterium]|nr:MAG: selenocysteine-specific translation elongation factor [Planctomycetota bacterium]